MESQKPTVLILGGGVGGVVAARTLKDLAGDHARVVVIDKNSHHLFAPGLLHLMRAERTAESLVRPLAKLAQYGIEFIQDEAVKIEPEQKRVITKAGTHQYEYLVIALGAELVPDRIPGLKENGFNLYNSQSVKQLRDALGVFAGGKLTIVITALPFKCPAAPYEAAFLLEEYFRRKGIRDRSEIAMYTPETLPMPAAGPDVGKAVKGMLEARSIQFHPEVALQSVDARKKELKWTHASPAPFDLLVYVPPHQGPRVVQDSGMGNENGWIPVDKTALKTKFDNVFAIGDCTFIPLATGKPLPKAGVFAHLQAEVVAKNIAAELRGETPRTTYDGRAYCFLEIGSGKAAFASGNFYAEPTPAVNLRPPGRAWYLGKQLFEKYWWWKWF